MDESVYSKTLLDQEIIRKTFLRHFVRRKHPPNFHNLLTQIWYHRQSLCSWGEETIFSQRGLFHSLILPCWSVLCVAVNMQFWLFLEETKQAIIYCSPGVFVRIRSLLQYSESQCVNLTFHQTSWPKLCLQAFFFCHFGVSSLGTIVQRLG